MAGEGGGPVGCLLHGKCFLVHGRRRFQLLQQYFCVTANHHQQIIEVVSHTTSQASHRFHFLCLAKLIFQHPPFCDVFGNDLQHLVRFRNACDGAPAQSHCDGITILASPLHFDAIQPSITAELLH